MSQTTLKWLRLITPGAIIILFAALLGSATDLWILKLPKDAAELTSNLIIIVSGGIYYVLPFRNIANKKHMEKVTENLRVGLLRIAKVSDDPKVYTWKAIRGIFFYLVDNDKSLTIKAKNAYFNGYIWTTLADVRALSIIFSIISLIVTYLNNQPMIPSAVMFLMIAVLSYFGSVAVTNQHIEIGNEQLEIIEHAYKETLKEKIGRVRERGN